MKPYSAYEIEFLTHPEHFTFQHFRDTKLDSYPTPVALSLADEELLNHYENQYEFQTSQNTRFCLQIDPAGTGYNELEEYVTDLSAVVLSEHITEESGTLHFRTEFSMFRRQLVDSLRSYKDIQRVQILKKIGIKAGLPPSEIDDISRLFSAGSSLFAMELFLGLKREGKLKTFLKNYPNSEIRLRKVAETPEILLSLWKHQISARDQWNQAGGIGIIQMATATGKTLVGLASAYHLYSNSGSLRVLVLCHSRAILNQWRREVIEKLGFIGDPNDDYSHSLSYQGKFEFSFETIQKAMKDPPQYQTDLLIVDEVHHGAGMKFREALTIPCRYKMGLSATVEGKEKNEVLDQYLGKSVFTYSLANARKDGIIPEFKLVIHKTFLDIPEEAEFASITEKITSLLHHINANQERQIFQLSRKKFRRFEHIGDFVRLMKNIRYRGDDIPDDWNHLIGLINQRRWVIHRSSPKIESAVNLTKNLAATQKCVFFAMDIATCEKIKNRLSCSVPSYLVHSKLPPHEVRSTLQRFRESQNGVLIAPKMLDEGIDIPDVEIGINVASSKTELQLIQRLGRILRNRPNKKPVFHHFVAIPRSYILSEDSFTYQNDLGWITDVALKMGIHIEEVIDESEAFTTFERKSEEAVQQYFTEHEDLTTDDFGTINVQNIVDTILPTAQVQLAHLLSLQTEVITDEEWARLLRSAYEDEQMLEIPSQRWLLVIGNREPNKIRDLILQYGRPVGEAEPAEDTNSAAGRNIPTITKNITSTNITVRSPVNSPKNVKHPVRHQKIPSAEQKSNNISFLISTLENNHSKNKSDQAVSALILKGSLAVEPLIDLLNNKDSKVRELTIGALGQIGDNKALLPLVKCLEDTAPTVRQQAARALGNIGDPRARLALTKQQRDPNQKVQKAATNALKKLSQLGIYQNKSQYRGK